MRKEKLTGQIMVHLPDSAAMQIRSLAEMKGETAGGYVRELINAHLDEKQRHFELMRQVFSSPDNDQ